MYTRWFLLGYCRRGIISFEIIFLMRRANLVELQSICYILLLHESLLNWFTCFIFCPNYKFLCYHNTLNLVVIRFCTCNAYLGLLSPGQFLGSFYSLIEMIYNSGLLGEMLREARKGDSKSSWKVQAIYVMISFWLCNTVLISCVIL